MTEAPLLVQKFGGTSVSTPERRAQVVDHVRAARDQGARVAVVVSAMGRRGDPYATDTLLDLLRADGGPVDPRDYDLMFGCGEAISVAVMCQALRRAGIPAQGLSAAQALIYTDGRHQEAEIIGIDAARLRAVMAGGEVPVVTGCQGVAPETLDVTILGRGGSDTSAVALAVALEAAKVEIFTDVAGMSTADPRLVPDAGLLRHVSFGAAYELSRFGATVVHPRAVRTGWRAGTPIVVRSTFESGPGTRIDGAPDEQPIVGLAALAGLETLVLAASDVDPATWSRWERLAVPAIRDVAREHVLVGTTPERLPELRDELATTGLGVAAELPEQAWLSVVGNVATLHDTIARIGGPASLGAAFEAWAEARLTIVVPEADRLAMARRLHAAAFGLPEPDPTSSASPPAPGAQSPVALQGDPA